MPTGGRLAALALAAVACAAAAAPAFGSGVSIQALDAEEPVTVSTEQIEALTDVPATTYRLRGAQGERTVTRSGTRLATVLRAAGLDPASLPTLELLRDDGTALYLRRDQIDPATGAPPLVFTRGRSVGFLRDSTGPGDLNAADSFTTPAGTPVRITVSPSAVLDVEVDANRERVAPHRPVRLDATVSGQLPGERLTYEWRFGDGATDTDGASTRHSFARRGRYEVVLQVTGDEGSGGSSEPLAIQVGRPARAAQNDGAGGAPAEEAPRSGATTGAPALQGPAPAPTPSAEEPTPSPPSERRSRNRARDDADNSISGRVITPAAAAPATNANASPSQARRGGETDDPQLGTAAGIALGVLLLGWGATRERRADRRRRRGRR